MSCESGKKRIDGAWRKPKRRDNGQSAAKTRTRTRKKSGAPKVRFCVAKLLKGKVQRLSREGVGPSGSKRFAPPSAGEDIVCSHVKAWDVRLYGIETDSLLMVELRKVSALV